MVLQSHLISEANNHSYFKAQEYMVNFLHLVPHVDKLLLEVSEQEKHEKKMLLTNGEVSLTLIRKYFDLVGFQAYIYWVNTEGQNTIVHYLNGSYHWIQFKKSTWGPCATHPKQEMPVVNCFSVFIIICWRIWQ